ncbi:MAG: hypothetical protein E6772_10185 [Dysgonomonas sp.]|nr:hypothetical protein [Dysgonomonas sp.]
MKTKYRNILVLFLAVIVFFVGAGVTIVDLCCTNCVENVLAMNTHNSACGVLDTEIDKHSCCSNPDTSNDVSPCTSQHEGECCGVERIDVDIDHRVFKPDLGDFAVSDFIHCFCCCFCHTHDIAENIVSLSPYSEAIPIPPREYLSLLRVLII